MNIDGTTSLPISSDNTILNLFECYLDAFGGEPPVSEQINPFDSNDGYKFDLYTETNSLLGESLYTLSSDTFTTDVSTVTRTLFVGQNNFNPFEVLPNGISLQIPLSSTDLIANGATAGVSFDTSDVIWQFVDGKVEGAWLKDSSQEFVADTACIKLGRGSNEFRYPYPNKGLSGEGLEWSGKGINNCETQPYISQDEKDIEELVEEAYWSDKSELTSSETLALNQTTLLENGATASKDINEADQILIKASKDSNDGIFAWAYDFDRTELPISCGSNYIYYPMFRYNDGEKDFSFNIDPDQVESKQLSTLDIIKDMCGAIAGVDIDSSDQILKQNGRCDSASEGAWLSGCPISTISSSVSSIETTTENICDVISFELVPSGSLSAIEGVSQPQERLYMLDEDETINVTIANGSYTATVLESTLTNIGIPLSADTLFVSMAEITTSFPPSLYNSYLGDETKHSLTLEEDRMFSGFISRDSNGNIPIRDSYNGTAQSLRFNIQGYLLPFSATGESGIFISEGIDITINNVGLTTPITIFTIPVNATQYSVSSENCVLTVNWETQQVIDGVVVISQFSRFWEFILEGTNLTFNEINTAFPENNTIDATELLENAVITKLELTGAARQTGLHMVANPSEESHFFWEFPDVDATLAINGYDHDDYCEYSKIVDFSSNISPNISDERNQWNKCNCKAVYYSPIGNNLDDYDSYKDFSDIMYIDSGIEPFSFTSWEDEDGNDYLNSNQFAVFKYSGAEPDAGYGVGYWETLKGEKMILKNGKSYVYKRASFGGCGDSSTPPLVVNSCHCYDKCNDNVCNPKWIKMVINSNGDWESTGEPADMLLEAGSFYQYIKKGKIEYQLTKQGFEYDRVTQTPSFSLNIAFNESKPYWAASENLRGYNLGLTPKATDEYLLTTQPEPSEMILVDDVYMKYTRTSCEAFEWKQPLGFTVDLNIPAEWKKIEFTGVSPLLLQKIVGCGSCELIFEDTPNSCAVLDQKCGVYFDNVRATNNKSDMILRTPVNCDGVTEIFYNAQGSISWEQEFNVVSTSGTGNSLVSVYSNASQPWNNLLNTYEALVRVHENDDTLKTKGELGVFKPEHLGISKLECFGKQNEIE